MDEEKRNSLLFDDVSFSRSKTYFGALQHLRVYDEWIKESLQSLEQLRNSFTTLKSEKDAIDVDQVDKEYNTLMSKYRRRFELLRKRIKDDVEEIMSLRDGVRSFNSFSAQHLCSNWLVLYDAIADAISFSMRHQCAKAPTARSKTAT